MDNTNRRNLSNCKTNRDTYEGKPRNSEVAKRNLLIKKQEINHPKWKKNDLYSWTKLVVPSRGSTIQVGSSVNSVAPQAAAVSSPMN